ncbi:MAG: M15 family metallopeptidase [Clostridiales bacterium]|nr:M15 family metallopeptidase [Clostridiales bacterium]
MSVSPSYELERAERRRPRRRRRRRSPLPYLLIGVILVAGAGILLNQWFGRVEVSENDPPTPGISSPSQKTTASSSAAAAATTTTSSTAAPTDPDAIGAGLSYVQPAGAEWYLMLANDWNEVPDSYDASASMISINGQRIDSRIEQATRDLLAAGAAYDIRVVSGYRPKAKQAELYEREVRKWQNTGLSEADARRKAATIVKQPGHSEHNLGLAMDLGGNGNYSLNEDFESTPAFRWLKEHCAEYGFILRFPKDKESITGVIYEPWHYRYVGKEAARSIMDRGITLEEYLQERHQ